MIYRRFGKRSVDLFASIAALPAVALVGACVAVAIKLDDGGSVLYVSRRRGRDGVAFNMYKFRSMVEDAPDIRNPDGSTLNSNADPRVTRLGVFLRSTSIDELPQLVNVLLGDMSLVGPRPNMNTTQIDELSFEERYRLVVRPGITGLSQSRYRNSAPASIRTRTDIEYVRSLSPVLDLKIMVSTLGAVIQRKNINGSES